MGNKASKVASSATKNVADKISKNMKPGEDLTSKLGISADLNSKMNSTMNFRTTLSSSVYSSKTTPPSIAASKASAQNPSINQMFDPEMLKEISKWSVQKKAATAPSGNQEGLTANPFDVKGTAMYVRHTEYEQHHMIISEGKSIPGRMTGPQLSTFLERYRNADNKVGESELSSLAAEFEIDLELAKNLVKWTKFPITRRDESGNLYAN